MKRVVKIKSIGQFGAFKGFAWDEHVKLTGGQVLNCKALNFIYGRNYSGKTTLSKILQAFELGHVPPHYDNAAFELEFTDHSVLSAAQVAGLDVPVRVFNRDFVTDNLAFLRDTRNDDGRIKSFAVLGEGSQATQTEIDAITNELGENKGDESTGLYKDRLSELRILDAKRQEEIRMAREVKRIKIKIASEFPDGIRYKPWCGDQNYNITKLDRDIDFVSQKDYQSIREDEVDRLKRIVNDTVRPTMLQPEMPPMKLAQFLVDAQPLLSRLVVQQEAIEDFINDSERETWARKGYELHKDNHSTCAFCGQSIPDQRWLALRKHFENEAEDLRRELQRLMDDVRSELESVDAWLGFDANGFYAAYEQSAQELKNRRNDALSVYRNALAGLLKILNTRFQSIATPCNAPLPMDVSQCVEKVYEGLAALVAQHNSYTNSLIDEQKKAKDKLRLHEVFVALRRGELSSKIAQEEAVKNIVEDYARKVEELTAEIDAKFERRNELRRTRHDESGAADLINSYLAWMGENNALRLETQEIEEDGVESKVFRIVRGDTPAYNLSEGECNLIAFCYFLAKLSAPELQNDKPIIWIDDPISSLDLNHIYFVYAMIRGVIIGEQKYGQLFISTHNLEFLRYLKRVADWKMEVSDKNERYPEWFFVHHTPNGATIEGLPKYLKNYVTEFDYLFSQIYNAAVANPNEDAYEKLIYGFGNAARRFLDIYLYFKFPSAQEEGMGEHAQQMIDLFGDKVRSFMVDRVINEMSHDPGAFERAMAPIDLAEIHRVAHEILIRVKKNDSVQYAHLLKAIGKEDPLEAGAVPQS